MDGERSTLKFGVEEIGGNESDERILGELVVETPVDNVTTDLRGYHLHQRGLGVLLFVGDVSTRNLPENVRSIFVGILVQDIPLDDTAFQLLVRTTFDVGLENAFRLVDVRAVMGDFRVEALFVLYLFSILWFDGFVTHTNSSRVL